MTVRNLLILIVFSAILAACAKGAAPPTTTAPLLIAPEDLHTIRNNSLASGPAITGSIQPER